MRWGEIALELAGFAIVAVAMAEIGTRLIAGLEEMLKADSAAEAEAPPVDEDGAPQFGSPGWVRRIQEDQE